VKLGATAPGTASVRRRHIAAFQERIAMPRLFFGHLITPAALAALVLGGCIADDDPDQEQLAPLDDIHPDAGPGGDPGDDAGDDPGDDHDAACGDDGCTSELVDYGLLCTTCPGDEGPECLAASCSVINRCLQCTDPKGRVGIDCSIDYESLPTASTGIGGGDTFNVCSGSWGYPGGASGVCHYPGLDSCLVTDENGVRCIDCMYPDGSGSGICLFDPNDPTPEILAGRPSGLPEPGECLSEFGDDGELTCSTCTRDDLSATKVCRFPPAESCDVGIVDDIEKCVTCQLVGGGEASICDDAGS
jgi:hypothetical protein